MDYKELTKKFEETLKNMDAANISNRIKAEVLAEQVKIILSKTVVWITPGSDKDV